VPGKSPIYCVLALKRSGHHGVITWLAHQLKAPVYFFSNVKHFANPFEPAAYAVTHREAWRLEKHQQFANLPAQPKKLRERIDAGAPVIVSFDDFRFSAQRRRDWHKNQSELAGASRRPIKYIVSLRDPFNNSASRLQCHQTYDESFFTADWNVVEHWKEYARVAVKPPNEQFIGLNYNRWFTSVDYRRSLAGQLEVPFSDAGLNDMLLYGKGSSFDQCAFAGNAQAMRVLERWRGFSADEKFLSAFRNDSEMVDLVLQLFGDDPHTMEALSTLVRPVGYAQMLGNLRWMRSQGKQVMQLGGELRQVADYLQANKLLPLRTLVEIGSWSGGSMFTMSGWAEPGARLISVDPWSSDNIDGVVGATAYEKAMEVFDVLKERGYDLSVIRDYSQNVVAEVVKQLDGRPLDLIHVDGGHQYEMVKRDWELYWPLVRPGGVMLIHDADNPKQPGVRKFLSEIKVTKLCSKPEPPRHPVGIAIVRKPEK